MWHFLKNGDRPRRRGAAAIFAMIMMVVLIGFAALTVDVGVLYNTRADLQNAADAAALAGAAAYATPAMVQVRLDKDVSANLQTVLAMAVSQAQLTAGKNTSFAGGGTAIEPDDIGTGWIDVTSATSPLDPNPTPANYNAVQVVVRRSKDSPNGPVRFFFAPIFGKHTTSVSASAVAVYDDHFAAYDVSIPGSASLWPFTISTGEYDNWVAGSTDSFSYDPATDQVSNGADGAVEVRLYPDKLAPGNYGLLNIGSPNQSTTALAGQIISGVSADDVEIETGTSELTFYDENGDPVGYNITGNPGLKASLESEIKARVGDTVAFFVHDTVSKNGSNANYHVTGIRFARVMFVMLQGSAPKRGLWMQPVSYNGPGVITVAGAPSSDGNAGQITLVR
jgi:hypothetical protein